ncbi:putative PurR-regulated permease PerM [Deinococcus humi]|uniref:Putative PurR-regulated permease PerM n=1 Tax=Deinococcus humi TaxID=662880 RepID=A0A7W8JV05_9DEIO|nr:putative PurR-regulated permease PerM [Deinococcus humi]GGO29525.1 hypothetical protein GCM10008949_23240 [Deinococcus humi]
MIIALIPALLLAAPLGIVKLALVVLVFIAANQVEGQFLSPLVLARQTDLHPATVLLSILSGVALVGVMGALLAVPLMALAKRLMEAYYYPSRLYQRSP